MADKAPPTMRMASSGKEREVSPRRTPFDSQPSRYAQLLEGLELVLEAGEGPANANNSPDDSPQVNEVKEVKEDVRAFVEQANPVPYTTSDTNRAMIIDSLDGTDASPRPPGHVAGKETAALLEIIERIEKNEHKAKEMLDNINRKIEEDMKSAPPTGQSIEERLAAAEERNMDIAGCLKILSKRIDDVDEQVDNVHEWVRIQDGDLTRLSRDIHRVITVLARWQRACSEMLLVPITETFPEIGMMEVD